jgi:hypothetical protein
MVGQQVKWDTGAIIDAGPALTFLARKDTTNVLLQGLRGGLVAPEIVHTEVIRKSRQKPSLRTAKTRWATLRNAGWIELLSDDETPALSAAVQRLCGMPMGRRIQQGKDLGELMVIAHAAVLAEAGPSSSRSGPVPLWRARRHNGSAE